MSSFLKANCKQDDFCITHFNELTSGNNVFSASVIVTSCSFYIKCSMSAGRRIQAGDASDQWRDSETLRQFATLSDISQGGVAIQLRCPVLVMIYTIFGPPCISY